jgi:glycosyltransferase involved in cell wall biosynthesis
MTGQPADSLDTSSPASVAALPLRVLHYLPSIVLAEGGVARAVLDWCAVFAKRGHQVTLLTIRGDDVPAGWLTDSVGKPRAHILKPLSKLRKSPDPETLAVLTRILRQTDVLHLHAPWLPGNAAIAQLAARVGVPYLVSIHGMLDDWSMSQKAWKKKLFMALSGRRFLNRAGCVHCTAEAELSQAKKWFDNNRTAVLPCLVDLNPFELLPGPEQALNLIPKARRDDLKVLFLSRIHEKKGVDILIRAAGLLRDAGLRFVVIIAGTGDAGYVDQLRQLVAELRLGDRVIFVGLIVGTQKISLYQAADLFVLPTAQENFGLVLTEALACGTPVVTTKGTDIWEEIQSAGAQIVNRTPEAIAAAAIALLKDPAKREASGRQGRDWVLANLAEQPLSEKYEAVYRETAGTR